MMDTAQAAKDDDQHIGFPHSGQIHFRIAIDDDHHALHT